MSNIHLDGTYEIEIEVYSDLSVAGGEVYYQVTFTKEGKTDLSLKISYSTLINLLEH
jgi:hypothetical protein